MNNAINKSFLILPGCDDTNRGDQALIWQTIELAKEAGYSGDFYMLADEAKSAQSHKRGIKNIDYILCHPSSHFTQTDNIEYTLSLKLKWAIVSVFDMLKAELLVHPFTRKIVTPLFGKKAKTSLDVFSNSNAAFVKGGGFLHAYGGLSETYKIYFFLYHIRLALSFGLPVYIMPNSFGPFNSPFVKKMLNSTLSKCKVVMSRENVSHEQLKNECGIDSHLFCDIAFFLNSDESFDAAERLRREGIPVGEKKCVSITARPYRFPGEADGKEKYLNYQKSIAAFISRISKEGYFPVLVEHVSDVNEHENDMSCITEIEKYIDPGIEYAVFSDTSLTCEQMKSIYSCFDYLVGTRFHSVIFSLSSGVPSVSITYGGNKGVGIMKDLGLDKYSVSISDITEDKLYSLFSEMAANSDSIKDTISQNKIKFANQKKQIVDLIKE